jgi:hypothetical protein
MLLWIVYVGEQQCGVDQWCETYFVVQQWRHETVVRGTRKRLQNRDRIRRGKSYMLGTGEQVWQPR